MSPSPKSKPESPSSRETGDETPDDAPAEAEAKPEPSKAEKKVTVVDVELEVQRQSVIGWTAFEYVLGVLLIWKLGTVGVWVGIALLVHAAYRTARIAQSFIYPPGTFRVRGADVTLPRGISMPRPLEVPASDVSAVYFLRRSVPWNKSSPVLVVELRSGQAIAYPRDWFASEADQRHIVHALLAAKEPSAK